MVFSVIILFILIRVIRVSFVKRSRSPFLYAYRWPLLKCSSEQYMWVLEMRRTQCNNSTAVEGRRLRNGRWLRTRQSKYSKRFLVEKHILVFSYRGYRYKTDLDLSRTGYHCRVLCMREDVLHRVNIFRHMNFKSSANCRLPPLPGLPVICVSIQYIILFFIY